ncbi:10025_t:CDS:2 [Entrophospora sp. SA101]|nr:10025_t:CDS:2 [Entrophospora sp. SA101]
MKEYRRIDDNIMIRLNSTNTHSEKSCSEFFKQLSGAYTKREKVINQCLQILDNDLEQKRNKAPIDNNIVDDIKFKSIYEQM